MLYKLYLRIFNRKEYCKRYKHNLGLCTMIPGAWFIECCTCGLVDFQSNGEIPTYNECKRQGMKFKGGY